jgi:nucleoside-diphosphate kinase
MDRKSRNIISSKVLGGFAGAHTKKPETEGLLKKKLEKTLIVIKPAHFHLAGDILKELDKYGRRIKTAKVSSVPREVAEEHYATHKGKFFYKWLVDSFVNKKVVIAIYTGKGVIQKLSEIIGPTDPSKAPEGTIRRRYSTDSEKKAKAEKRTIANVVHKSSSAEEAEREINVWQRFLR